MITLKDIAQEAGVSSMTISNVIHNNREKVSDETFERVSKIIKKYNYTPNMHARSLASNISKVILLCSASRPSSPFMAEIIDCFENKLSTTGYYLMIKTISEKAELKSFLTNWQPDGVALIGQQPDELVSLLTEHNIPSVFIDQYSDREDIVCIRIEDFNGGFIATEHLIKCGHKNIAFLSSSSSKIDSTRLDGYKAALKKHNIGFSQSNVYFAGHNRISADITKQLINSGTTAVFVTSDMLAINLIKELKASGKSVPDDISIVGFDDSNISNCISPALTTIHQDSQAKGFAAVESLIAQLKGDTVKKGSTVLSVSLVERDSVKKL